MHNGDEPQTHYYDSAIDGKVDRALDHLAAEDDQTYNECMWQDQIVVATAAIWTQRIERLMAFERDVPLPYVNLLFKQPYHTYPFRGIDWVNDLLHPDSHPGRNQRIRAALGVHRHVFEMLLRVLRYLGYSETRSVQLEEQLAIFLHGCVKGMSVIDLGERFQRSNEIISKYFLRMLHAFASDPFYSNYVKLPLCDAPTPLEIASNPKFYPYFKDALGALDGSHIFTYVLNGWEGSTNDASVYNDARLHDLRVPQGRYYLADAGYATHPELLIPYPGIRYHLAEWDRADHRSCNKEELFNLRHASAHNVVERIFGVMKKRFKILRDPPGYNMKIQVLIMPSTTSFVAMIPKKSIPSYSFLKKTITRSPSEV